MGLATLLIILCHMPAHGVVMPEFVAKILSNGGIGVDVFLFLSGMGIYFSLRNKNISLHKWYLKRLVRIYVPWFIFAIPFYVFTWNGDESVSYLLLKLSTFSYWVDGNGLWFVALIIPLYFVSPLLLHLIKKRNKWFVAGIIIIAAWLIGSRSGMDGCLSYICRGVSRVPCYILGFVMGEDIINKRRYSLEKYVGLILLLLTMSLMIRFIFHIKLSLFWLQGMLFLIVCAKLMSYVHFHWMRTALLFMGTISLESYFTNVDLLICFKKINWDIGGHNINYGNWTYYLIGTGLCVFLSWLIHNMSQYIIKLTKL